MSKLILPPTLIQTGTDFETAKPFINDDFESLATSFNGFVVQDQIAFPDNTASFIVPAGGLGVAWATVTSPALADDIIFLNSRISIFIDPPPNTDPNAKSYDTNYLYPTGSALTTGQLKMVYGASVSISPYAKVVPNSTNSFTASDGKTYYDTNIVTVCIRNADSVSHGYFFELNQSVYSSNTNQFR